MVFVTQKNHFRSHVEYYSTLKWLSHKCKNLYNKALYLIKTHFAKTGHYLSEKELYKQIKSHTTYQQLHSDNAQLTLRTLRQNYTSYFKLLKLKKNGEYETNINSPSYLAKDGYFIAQFIPRQMKRMEKNQMRLSLGKRGKKSMGTQFVSITIPPNIRHCVINMVRIIPKYHGKYLEIEYIYQPQTNITKFDYSQFLGIDLGLNNFVAAASTSETAFIIEGLGIKSYNRWWNKLRAKLQSQHDRQGIPKWNGKMVQMNVKRYNVMRNYTAHAVNLIVKHCVDHKIGNIVVGEWDDMKRGLKMPKKVAQQFQQIPYRKFKDNLKSKAELNGIQIEFVDEKYTSQTCSGCGLVRKANRIKRGLYRCKRCKLQLNADINAAVNIVRKVAPNSFSIDKKTKWSSGEIISPKRLRIVDFQRLNKKNLCIRIR